LTARSAVALADCDSAQLDLARQEIQSLAAVLGKIAPLFERLHGRGAFGLGTVTRFVTTKDPQHQMLMLLGWLVLRSSGAVRDGLRQIATVAPQATATAQLYEVIRELRDQVPELTTVLSDRRLAEAQRDKDAADAVNSEIAGLRRENVAAFDEFFAAHPEVNHLIAVIEASDDQRS
jgi:hypothetical protein